LSAYSTAATCFDLTQPKKAHQRKKIINIALVNVPVSKPSDDGSELPQGSITIVGTLKIKI
jgi:hypothetical protein